MTPLTPLQIKSLANKVVGDGESELLCLNLGGQVRYANTSACSRLGYAFGDMIKKNIADYTPNHTAESWQVHCNRTIHNGSDEIYTYHRNCSGDRYPVVMHSVPHMVNDTSEQLICSIIQRAEDSSRYKRMLEMVESSQRIGSFDYRLSDQSMLASDNLLAIMGTDDPESLRPTAIPERLNREDTAKWNAHLIDFASGYHRMEEEFVMRTAANRHSLVRATLWSSMGEGKATGIHGYFELINDTEKDRLVSLEENQRRHIIRALQYTNGRVTGPNGAGRLLDINGKTLFARMKKLNINREDYTSR
jgi:PAS domain S-box-containing protein